MVDIVRDSLKDTRGSADVQFERFEESWIERPIFERFEYIVARHGNKIAVDDGVRRLTYREVMRACKHLASRIDAQVPPQAPVGVMLPNCALVPIAALACLAVGRPFVPLDLHYPTARNEKIMAESGMKALLVDHAGMEMAKLGVDIPQIDITTAYDSGIENTNIADASDPAIITYTSGSTGRPKGVCVDQQSITFNVADFTNSCRLNVDDRIILLSSASLLISYWSIFGALLNGGTIFIADPRRIGINGVLRRFHEGRITICLIVPALLRSLINSSDAKSALGELRVIQLGGETVYVRDVENARAALASTCQIQIGYGSTEAAGLICKWFVPPGWNADGPRVPCGYPLSGHSIWVAQENRTSLGRGELLIKSRYIALGLWQDGSLQQGPFEQDPIDPSVRILRTGDLVQLGEDGLVEIIGRKDRQVKIGGLRVNPREIEDTLCRCSNVAEAAVVARDDDEGVTALVAYVVPIQPAVASFLADLKAAIASQLPRHSHPAHIHLVSKIPLLPNFKPDVIALAALAAPFKDEARRAAFRAPSDDRERELLAIWQEVLKLPTLGIDDDFFELGGTSLQALMMFARIETRLGCSLSPTTIVRAPTIARLAEFIRATTDGAASPSLVPLRTSGAGPPLFLVHNLYPFVVYYRHLLSDLNCDRPVFGLQPPPLDGMHRIARTIESMAADYVRQIRRVQPYGPYFLAGHSFGGRVSFEIAQQLVAEGDRVSFLGLIDTILGDEGVPSWASKAMWIARHSDGFQDLLFREARLVRSTVSMRQFDLWARLGRPVPYERQPGYFNWLYVRANRDHMLKPYRGHITVFSSAGNSERQRAFWTPLACGGLTVLEVPASHDDMVLPPHSKLLAEYIDACLDSAVRGE